MLRPAIQLLLLAAVAAAPALGRMLPAQAGEPVDSAESGAAPRPNVLVLLADDLGWRDVGFNNARTFYDTPNLDRLAAGGMRFTSAYAACPVCSPTRASLMTGRHPARLDATDWFGAPQPEQILRSKKGRFAKQPVLGAPYVDRLVQSEVTLAESLKAAGYATFFAGKWHLGGEGFEPETQGFDVNVAGHHRGGPYGPGRYFHPFGMPGLTSEEGDHLPDRLAEETSGFIRSHAGEPWLCYLSFYSVHTPLMGRPDLVEHYEVKRQSSGLADLPASEVWGKEGQRKVRQVQEHAVYAAMVAAMDEAVGDVLGTLDELGLADDTLVVFFSDNGGLSTSEGHPTSNLPLRGGKGWLYEGGVREPCVVRWPGHIEPASVSDVPIQSVDLLPTVLAATSTPMPDGVSMDGVNLVPLLTGVEGAADRLAGRPLFWHYPHYGNQGGFPGGAVREGRWKLIQRYDMPGQPTALYDLGSDLGESKDVSGEAPARAARLLGMLEGWRTGIAARMPTPNPLLEGDGAASDR